MLGELSILVPNACELFLGVFEGKLLCSQIVAADVHKFLSVGNAGQSSTVFVFELLELVVLVVCLMSPLLIGVLEMADLAVHFRALNFNGLNLAFKVGFVATLVSALVSL